VNAQRKPRRLPTLLAILLASTAALLLAPGAAGAWPSGSPAFAHRDGTGAAKHASGKRCRDRARKSRRGCHSHRHLPTRNDGKPTAPPSSAATQTPPAPQSGTDSPAAPGRAPEEAEPDAPETVGPPAEEPPAEEVEAEADEGEESEGEAEAEEVEAEETEEDEQPEEAEEASSVLTSAVTAPTGALRWAPPTLVEPKTITLGTGYTHTTLLTNRDYIVKLPATKKVGGTWIDGGHNVVIVGGYITVPQGSSSASANETTALSIKGATGTVHVEGVLIDGSGGGEFDGVTINAPEATVQLENLRIIGVRGGYEHVHADVLQPWGGVKDLRIDRLTGRSNYQGLTLKPDLGAIGSAEFEEIDVTATTEGTVDRGGHMLWLTRGVDSCVTYPMTLSNVFVTPRPGKQLSGAVWPQKDFKLACPGSGTKSSIGWPALPVLGSAQLGPPPTGNYVPAGVAGVSYLSPGYRAG
jgi:hypothetical protein